MKELKQELKDSKRYEWMIHPDGTYDFVLHNKEVNIQFIKTLDKDTNKEMEHIEIILHDNSMPEGYVAAKIFIELPLENLETIIWGV